MEATLPNYFLRGLTNNFLYGRYAAIYSNVMTKEFKNIMSESSANEQDIGEINTTVLCLTDNKDLVLGDVLADNSGEIYFFMAPTAKHPVTSTLLKASTGLFMNNYDISLFSLIKKFESTSFNFLDYKSDPEVLDIFKIIQRYDDYVLLNSSVHSIVFVAPNSNIDSFIRVDLQARINTRKAPKIDGNISAAVLLPRRQITGQENYDQIESPNTVAGVDANNNESHVQMFFDKFQGDNNLRSRYIQERFSHALLNGDVTLKDTRIILRTAERVFRADHMVEYINVGKDQEIVVVGDIHGQFVDLLRIFRRCGWPSENKKFLFNGDIVDRGNASIECLLLLYVLKITFPKSVYINRGNHESEMCGPGTFYQQSMKFDPSGRLFKAAQEGFLALPIASVINDRIYVVHAGIRGDYDIKNISGMDRFNLSEHSKSYIQTSLWDDASEINGITCNKDRGDNCFYFGPNITERFLQLNNFNRVIRSHSFVHSGFQTNHDGNVWTIFSAPNYCGANNRSAVIVLNNDLEYEFEYFKPMKMMKASS